MNISWITRLHDDLIRLRRDARGWGNRPGGKPYVEPTALAALSLAASEPATNASRSRDAVAQSADWLAELQQEDGSLGISPDLPQPHWTTPLGVLVWSAAGGGSTDATIRAKKAQRKAIAWLLLQSGETWNPTADTPYGHDTRIPGWPWVEKTHSWLEPTALAVLALRLSGQAAHPRSHDGVRLIHDRAIRTGGWNYGNSAVFGADLRPQPAPTGLALLALATVDDFDEPVVERGCTYLEKILPTTHAPQSLCFGMLALSAWGRRPANAEELLTTAYDGAARSSNSIAQLAYLLLAAGPRALVLLGVAPLPGVETEPKR